MTRVEHVTGRQRRGPVGLAALAFVCNGNMNRLRVLNVLLHVDNLTIVVLRRGNIVSRSGFLRRACITIRGTNTGRTVLSLPKGVMIITIIRRLITLSRDGTFRKRLHLNLVQKVRRLLRTTISLRHTRLTLTTNTRRL